MKYITIIMALLFALVLTVSAEDVVSYSLDSEKVSYDQASDSVLQGDTGSMSNYVYFIDSVHLGQVIGQISYIDHYLMQKVDTVGYTFDRGKYGNLAI